jgi:hypothetical protein
VNTDDDDEKRKEEEEMNCPDDDFIFQQQKILFLRLRFFFLSFSPFFFFSVFLLFKLLFSYECSLQQIRSERIYQTILDETAHQRRDDAFSFFFSPQNETASENVKEKEKHTEEFLLLFYVHIQTITSQV